jgi:hypothetical protein
MTLRKWGPRVLLAVGVILAGIGVIRGQPEPGHYALTHADWAFVGAGIIVGAVALAWNAWEWHRGA